MIMVTQVMIPIFNWGLVLAMNWGLMAYDQSTLRPVQYPKTTKCTTIS